MKRDDETPLKLFKRGRGRKRAELNQCTLQAHIGLSQ
jgi:hypothetical protein